MMKWNNPRHSANDAEVTSHEDPDNGTTAERSDAEQGQQQPRQTTRRKVLVRAALAMCLVAAAALTAGLVVGINNDSTNKGDEETSYTEPPYINIYQPCYNQTDSCTYDSLAQKVRLTADGSRLFVAGETKHAVFVQVFKQDDDASNQWERLVTISPPGRKNWFKDFALARDAGTRFLLSYSTEVGGRPGSVVSVYEQEQQDTKSGTNNETSSWIVTAEITDADFATMASQRLREFWRGNEHGSQGLFTRTESWGTSVDISPDGNTIAVGAPRANLYYNDSYVDCEQIFRDAGAAMVFRHRSALEGISPAAEDASNFTNRTWVPMDRVIHGFDEEEFYGEQVKLLGSKFNNIVTFCREVNRYDLKTDFQVFDFTDGDVNGGPIISLSLIDGWTRRDSRGEGIEVSPDGMFLVLANPKDAINTAGDIRVLKSEDDYEIVPEIEVEDADVHLGTSLAIGEDYTIVAGFAVSSNDYTYRSRHYIKVFRYHPEKLEDAGSPENGDYWVEDQTLGSADNGWWTSFDVTADGSRVVAAQSRQDVRGIDLNDGLGERRFEGAVAVFDLNS